MLLTPPYELWDGNGTPILNLPIVCGDTETGLVWVQIRGLKGEFVEYPEGEMAIGTMQLMPPLRLEPLADERIVI